MRSIVPVGFLIASAVVVSGQDKPLLFPLRDVVVQSQLPTPRGGKEVTDTSYLVSERKVRVAPKADDMYVLIDYQARIMINVYPGQPTTYMSSYLGDEPEPAYARTGEKERIAGYDCAVWQAPATEAKNPMAAFRGMTATYSLRTTLCVTADGVTLRTINDINFHGQRTRTVSDAVKVVYGPQDPSMFRLPTGAVRK